MTVVRCNATACQHNKDNVCTCEEILLEIISTEEDVIFDHTDCQTFVPCRQMKPVILEFDLHRTIKQTEEDDPFGK